MVPTPTEPVTQVVFVHDYFQVVFDDETFNLCGDVEVRKNEQTLVPGQPGFGDAMVELVGDRALALTVDPSDELTIQFLSGTILQVRPNPSGCGPEAWVFRGPKNLIIAGSNYA